MLQVRCIQNPKIFMLKQMHSSKNGHKFFVLHFFVWQFHFLRSHFWPMDILFILLPTQKLMDLVCLFLYGTKVFKIRYFKSKCKFRYFRVPFNWKDPVGYFYAMVILFGAVLYVCAFTGSVLCFLIGICFMLMALADDIIIELIAVNELSKCHKIDSKLSRKVQSFIEMQRIQRQLR